MRYREQPTGLTDAFVVTYRVHPTIPLSSTRPTYQVDYKVSFFFFFFNTDFVLFPKRDFLGISFQYDFIT